MSIHRFSNLAKNLAVGEFAIVNDAADDSGYDSTFTASGIATFNSFAYKATYDPLWHRIFIMGDGGHLSGGTAKFACYELDYDRWTLIGDPPFDPTVLTGPTNHLYGLQAHVSKPGSNVFFRLPHNRTNVFTWETDHQDLADIVYQGQVYSPPLTPDVDNGSRGNFEYFPERDELIFHFSFGGNIYTKPYASGSWAALTGWTDSALLNAVKHDGVGMLYHPVAKCVVWGGGSDLATTETTNTRWWRYDADGSITELDQFLFDQNGLVGWAAFGSDNGPLLVADPGSKKYVMFLVDFNDLSSIFMFELDPFASTGNQWTQLDSSLAANWPADLYNSVTSNITAICIPEYNVMFFSAYNKTWIYRHSAALNFTQKAAMHGVLSSFPLSSQSELQYTWQNAGDSRIVALENALASMGSGIGYDYPWPYDINRTSGQGNTVCSLAPANNIPIIPQIADGGLRFTIPGKVNDGLGSFNVNFDGVLHDDPADALKISPVGASGRVAYIQFEFKADAAFWSNQYGREGLTWVDTAGSAGCACTSNSDIISIPSGSAGQIFTAGMVGREVAILGGSGAFFAQWGYYTITEFIDSTHVRLNATPASGSNGTSGLFYVEGDGSILQTYGGVKLVILTGAPPEYGGLVSLVVTAKNHAPFQGSTYFNGPSLLGIQGTDVPSNDNDALTWNETDWNEITLRIEVGPGGLAEYPSPDSRLTVWLNGLKDDPGTDWYTDPSVSPAWGGPIVGWSADVGFGWLQFTPQMTHKDPCWEGADANVYYRNLLISTMPIPMGGSAAVAPETPTASQRHGGSLLLI